MKKPSLFRIVVSYITAYSMMFLNVAPVYATTITGVTGNNGVYDIPADKISGETGFRQYEKFELSDGDIANLQFKKDTKEYSKFVNLVDNKVDINGIVNTVKGDAFYNGHAIFVSPKGIVVGASGVLNVGSLTMMAPSENAYKSFKDNYGANIKDVEFDVEHENYKSLIRNSSGTIEINGKVFAKDTVSAYGRQIKVQKNEAGNGDAAVFAGVQDQKVLTKTADADALFNSLVSKNITSASDFNLQNGKISLVTNKANDEVITTVKTSEENGKKYKTTTEINTGLKLKKETKEEIKTGDGEGSKETTYSIDKTYEKSSLSSAESSITITGAKIAANNVDIQANAESVKTVDEDIIKNYSEAANKAEQSSQSGQSGQQGNTGGTDQQGQQGNTGGTDQQGQQGNTGGTDQQDKTTGYKIPDEFKDVAPEANATVTILSSKIYGDKIAIKANAVNKTQTYIQLLDPIWEKWISVLGMDLLLRILNKMSDEPLVPEGTDLPWFLVNMVKEYFSDKAYTGFDGAKATATVNILGSDIVAKDSVDIEADSEAVTNISTGRLDSHPLFFYGLGVKAESNVEVSGASTIKTTGDESEVNFTALAQTEDNIKYDSSNFLAISDKPTENNQSSGNNDQSSGNNDQSSGNNDQSSGNNDQSSGNNDQSPGNNDQSSGNNDQGSGNNDQGSGNNDQGSGNSEQGGQQSTVSAYNLTLLNNSIFSDANVKVDGSTVETKDFNAKAIDFNKSNIEMKNISNVGANSEKTGIAAAMLINHTRTNSSVEISNQANIKAENDAKLLAQNINYLQNSVESEVKAKAQNYDIQTKDLATYDPTYTIKAYNWLNKKFLGKVTSKIGDILDKVQSEISGSAIWNDEQNTSTSAIDNSTVTSGNADVVSNMVDFTLNTAESNAGATKKFSAGAAIIVNDQSNTNNAKVVNNATITADENVNISATTQLPMNPMQMKIGQKVGDNQDLELFVGGSFDGGDSVNSWNAEFIHTKLSDLLSLDSAKKVWNGIKSPRNFAGSNKIDMDGLFNNLVKAEATSDGFGIAGSVLANSILNNTNAFIENSKISAADGNVNINAANSVINYNGAGKVDFLIDGVNELIERIKAKPESERTQEEEEIIAKFGIGGSVLVDKYTNNANAYIKSSDVSAANENPTAENAAKKGNINVNAASEEGYINLAVTGGKANWLALQGSVNVQRIDGKTKAYISDIADTQKVEADNINVIAGKASIAPKKTGGENGDPVELSEETGELSVNTPREVKDSVMNVSIIGANAQQEGSGVSVGASVDVTKISKEVEAAVTNSTISARKDVAVTADTSSKKIDVLMAGAFAGGVSTDRTTQESANNGNDSTTGEDRPQQMQNAGNWMDEVDNAQDDEEDVMNLRDLFAEDGNNAAQEGAKGLNGTDGRESSGSQSSSTGPTSLTGDASGANPTTAQKNISVALAGAVDVTNDYTKTTAKVENSTINAGKEVNVTADNDILAVQVNGALAKSSTVSAGAGVNIYNNRSETKATIDNSTINFNSANAKGLNVTADTDIDLIDVTAGIGIASKGSFGASVGGSFGFNKLHNTVLSQIIDNTIVKTEGDNIPDVDVKVEAKDDSKIWNITGAAGFGKSEGVNIGAGIAATLNYGKKTITAAIIDSTLSNVKDVTVNADLQQDYNTIAVAAELSVGKKSSFTFDGAVNTEWNGNRVTALAKDSTITASGDVAITANADIKNQSLAGAVDFQTSKFGVGVGIGSIINVNKSAIRAEADGLTVTKSKSLSILADEIENLKFLAANLGIKTGGGATININGIANVFLSEAIADAINNSVFNSNGNISITAGYDNNLQGITAVAEFAKGLVVGPNLIGNVYNNTVTANLENGSEIQKARGVAVNATAVEEMNLIPVSAGVSTNIAAVAANANANIVKNTVEALLGGTVTQSSSVLVNAVDDTTIYTRGGTLSAGTATVVIAGSVNVDVISKTVHAYVNNGNVTTSGNMSVFASSINSMGGTKDANQKYETDDVTTDAYRNKMLNKDEKGNYVGLKEGGSFANWNMFYDLSGGKTAAVAGATIVKSIHNEVQAEILNSEIKANNLDVAANEYSIKNIVAGTLEGAGALAVGVNVLVMRDKSETKALVGNNSKLTIANTLNLNASNKKDNQQIVIAGGGAGTVAANTNTVVNKIDDVAIAQIDNQNGENKISAGTINIKANEDMNASHILAAVSGSGMLAFSVAPIVNTYNGTVDASIKNAKVNDAAINIGAQTNISTFDVDAGVAGAGNVAGTAVAIKNNYTGHTKAYMDNATINTSSAIAIAADAAIKSENWIGALAVTGMGASLLVNLVLNNIISETEAGIKNSTIQNAGDITISTNKGKMDDMKNRALSIGFTAQGAALVVGVVQNIYKNTVKSYAENNAVTKAVSMALNANSDRKLDNKTIGATAAAIGAGAVANALVNQIDSSTTAIVDAQSKTMNIDNALNLNAKDNTVATNSMGMIAVAGMGAAIGGNINLYYANNLANAKILSNSDGQINAGSSSVIADMINGLENMIIGVSLGAGTLAADVAVIRLGKRTSTYSEAESGSKINDAVSYTQNIYNKSTTDDVGNVKNLYTPTSSADDIKTGAVAEVNGNLKTTNDTKIEAKSKIKGLKENSDTLELRNVNVSGGIASANVGVKNIKLASNTLAEISGGKVESTSGDVSVNADSKADVKLKNTEVTVSGVALSGAGAIYNNTSETVAQVKNAAVKAKDLNIVSKSDNKSEVDSTSVIVSGANAIVDIAENTDTNKSAALITGNVDIDTSGKLTLHSTTNTELDSAKAVVKVSVASLVGISKNENEVKSINRALIENATGSIKTNGLEITTDYGKMYAHSKSNVTSVQLADIANIKSVGAHMNADFKSGIDSLGGLTINNKGTTTINTAKDITSNQEGIVAKSEIHNVGVSLLGFYNGTASKAQNTAKSSTVLKAKEHTANGLEINADLKSTAKAEGGATNVSLAGVSNFVMYAKDESTLNVDVAGVNNIIGSGTGGVHEAKIKAKHQSEVRSDASAVSAGLIAGHRMRLTSELVSNTTGNIGGTMNADKVTVDFDTTRNSVLNKSSSSGGVIDVGDAGATNTLTGSSVLTVSASSSKEKAVNAMDVKNKSTNTFDMTSSDGHGGLLSISEGNTTTTFNTSTTTNLVNTNINSSSDVKYEVSNNAFIKDTATSRGGGLIAVYGNYHTGNFTSAANLSLNNAKINAKNIDLKTSSDLRTSDNGYISYTGAAGGFVAGSTLELRNTLDQYSSLNIAGNSNLNASENAKLSAKTASGFKQKVDSTAGAFVAVPRARSYLTVNNNNNINIAAGSKIRASNELEINFDSNNDLASRTNAEAHHFGFKDPVAESYLTLNINNNLNNSGSLEAGNLVDINYMGNSTNNLEQFAYSEAHAAIATTTENGELKKDLRNNLNIASGGDITSGKSIDVNYSSGGGNSSSYIGWKTVSYALFGIPIEKGDSKSNALIYHIPTLQIDGKMVAGQSNSRYMKINRDGSVDMDTLLGFYNDDYKLYDNQSVDGDDVKQRSLAAIEIEINNIDSTIVELSEENESLNKLKTDAEKDRDATQAKLDELNGYITDGNYELLDENSSLNDKINADIKARVIKTSESDTDKLTEAEYNAIMAAYSSKKTKSEMPSMKEFLADSSNKIMTERELVQLTPDQLFNISNAIDENFKTSVITNTNEAGKITTDQYNAIMEAYNSKKAEAESANLELMDFLNDTSTKIMIGDEQLTLSEAQLTTINNALKDAAEGKNIENLVIKTSAGEGYKITTDQYNAIMTVYNSKKEETGNLKLMDFLNDTSNEIVLKEAEQVNLSGEQLSTIENALQNSTEDTNIKALVIKTSANEADRITEAQYNAIVNAYEAKLNERLKPLTISDFLSGSDSSVISLSDAQKQTILDAYRLADSDDVKGLIVKTSANEENRLTEDQYNTLVTAYSTAYNNKLAEIAEQNKEISLSEFLDGSSNTIMMGETALNLTDAQKQTIKNMENEIGNKIAVSNSGDFLIYDNKYVAVSNPTTETVEGTSVASCDEIKQYKTELSALDGILQQYEEKLNANEQSRQDLVNRKNALGTEREEIINAKYENRNELYSIVFYDLYSDTANINISGADNRSISDDSKGDIIVAQPGLQVDNYSNRSLIFNDIDFGNSTSGNGLTINGKNHAIFMDTKKAVSGMDTFFYWYGWGWGNTGKFSDIPDTDDGDGVHYKSGTQGVTSGITINTYYDSNSPFIDKYAPESGTIFTGDIINSGNQMTVTNNNLIIFMGQTVNSGKTTLVSPTAIIAELTSDKVDINDDPDNWEQNKEGTVFNLGAGSYLFGGNAVVVEAEKINIKGDVVSGYKNRGITITDDMLKEENLIVDPNTIDPVTGEGDKNLINLGGNALSAYLNDGVNNGNIKAIYKDGEIHVFNLPLNTVGNGIEIVAKEGTSSTVEGNVIVHNNHTMVNIDNQTTNNVPLNIYDLYNEGNDGDIRKTLKNVTIVTADNGTGSIIADNDNNASVTDITSTGTVKLHGIIANNVVYAHEEPAIVSKPDNSDGKLNILVKNGGLVIDEYKNFFDFVDDAIVNSGDINIKLQNNVSAVINGKINNTNGSIFIGNDTGKTAGDITLNALINNKKVTDSDKGDIIIDTQGSVSVNNTISNEKKGIEITAHKGVTTANNTEIKTENGNVKIANEENQTGENSGLLLNGDVVAGTGNITIENKQGAASVVGNIETGSGNIKVENSNDGALNVSGNLTTKNTGSIAVTNGSKDGMTVSGAIDVQKTGDVTIDNSGGKLNITSDATIHTEKGNIAITNTGAKGAEIAGTITNANGNTSINNANGLTYTASLTNTGGSTSVINSGDANMSGTISNAGGSTTITNSNGKLDLSTTVA
ncbi:MAG: hypothetical protein IJ218_02030, partial [Alphaproteobacteria bacterium]|nr:hypothetical protein [Alphaproteobacteria bacterium]